MVRVTALRGRAERSYCGIEKRKEISTITEKKKLPPMHHSANKSEIQPDVKDESQKRYRSGRSYGAVTSSVDWLFADQL